MNFYESIEDTEDMSELMIAIDFLLTAKNNLRNDATAISEAITPELRKVLKEHLETSIATHEAILLYMINKGYHHALGPIEEAY